ncbi:hypothetical protein LUZ61_007285 [Rhynchospora tenuis]|uniref:O-methyltransferase C-terminal domain-containing protein n=1 Tax=Rhynchospora tenuis TaxID=198213 RepID=A0AAD5ZT71_9POAL|nr:hypothetical protein LUZ61_007285 [Rhynchospora tenuis]
MLDRMLALLASFNIVSCTIDEKEKMVRRYGPAPFFKWLTKDENGATAANLVLLAMEQAFVVGGQHLKDAVLEGGVAFEKAHGITAFEYMGTDPSFSMIFNKAMMDNSTFTLKKMLEIYQGFKDVRILVDIGGGVGAALRMIVLKYPHIKGINLDLPHVISAAPAFPGVEHVGGSMFDCIPHGDTILLKWVLHNWSDEHCMKVLKNCYTALPAEGKVIVVDGILPVKPQPTTRSQATYMLDVLMLSNFGGKERTKNEFENLAKEAGFAQRRAQPWRTKEDRRPSPMWHVASSLSQVRTRRPRKSSKFLCEHIPNGTAIVLEYKRIQLKPQLPEMAGLISENQELKFLCKEERVIELLSGSKRSKFSGKVVESQFLIKYQIQWFIFLSRDFRTWAFSRDPISLLNLHFLVNVAACWQLKLNRFIYIAINR